MADAGNAANAAEGQQPRQGQSMLGMVIRLGMMYFMMQYMRSGKEESTDSGVPTKEKLLPYMPQLEPVNFEAFISDGPGLYGKRVWHEKRLPLAAPGLQRRKTITLFHEDLSPVWERNQTLYFVTRFTRSSQDLPSGPDKPMRVRGHSTTKSIPLVMYQAPPKKSTGKSLLGLDQDDQGDAASTAGGAMKSAASSAASAAADSIDGVIDGDDEDSLEGDTSEPEGPWLPYLKPNLTISMVNDFAAHGTAQLPPHFLENVDISFEENRFHPIVHISEFWLLRDYLVPLNDTVTEVQLHLELDTMHSMWWQGMLAFQMSFDMQKSNGLLGEREIEEVKRIFLEGNPYLLALTMVVSLLHTVFDALAFKNDIGFWKDNKSMEGLSARTVIINAFCQLIIFLYLLDNETSTVVLLSSGVGAAIEFWKVTKVMDVRLEQRPNGLPRLTIKDRGSYVKTKTREYDEEATRYMSYALIPLVIGYFIYSLVYDKYKSWYSFVLQTLVGCVYAFGFILMCPQLYLNYKLKSVAHLPWRQMTYKFLNTIIDDLFAFVIKMPILHRLSVFRDDVIFLIYLYQRWIYRVDKSRVNEFGFTGDGPEPVESGEGAAAITDGSAEGSSAAAAASTAVAGSGKASSRRKGSKKVDAEAAGTKPGTETSKDK